MPIHKGMLETWNMYMSEEKKRREKDAVQKIYRRGMRWGGLCNTQGKMWFRAVFTLLYGLRLFALTSGMDFI